MVDPYPYTNHQAHPSGANNNKHSAIANTDHKFVQHHASHLAGLKRLSERASNAAGRSRGHEPHPHPHPHPHPRPHHHPQSGSFTRKRGSALTRTCEYGSSSSSTNRALSTADASLDLCKSVAKALIDRLRACTKVDVSIAPGLSEEEFHRLELNPLLPFTFPPCLKLILREGLPVGYGFPDWRSLSMEGNLEKLRLLLNLPSIGLCYEVARNHFWLSRQWGGRPSCIQTALRVARSSLSKAPLLVPLYRNFYIPNASTCLDLAVADSYDPVLFICGSHVSVCNFDLAGFFENIDDFIDGNQFVNDHSWKKRLKEISFGDGIHRSADDFFDKIQDYFKGRFDLSTTSLVDKTHGLESDGKNGNIIFESEILKTDASSDLAEEDQSLSERSDGRHHLLPGELYSCNNTGSFPIDDSNVMLNMGRDLEGWGRCLDIIAVAKRNASNSQHEINISNLKRFKSHASHKFITRSSRRIEFWSDVAETLEEENGKTSLILSRAIRNGSSFLNASTGINEYPCVLNGVDRSSSSSSSASCHMSNVSNGMAISSSSPSSSSTSFSSCVSTLENGLITTYYTSMPTDQSATEGTVVCRKPDHFIQPVFSSCWLERFFDKMAIILRSGGWKEMEINEMLSRSGSFPRQEGKEMSCENCYMLKDDHNVVTDVQSRSIVA